MKRRKPPAPIAVAEILDLAGRAEAAGQAGLARALYAAAGRMDPASPRRFDHEEEADIAWAMGLDRACRMARKAATKGVFS